MSKFNAGSFKSDNWEEYEAGWGLTKDGINAVAGLHDMFQINMTGLARNIFNVPGMVPAAVITYAGMTDQYGVNSQLAVKDRIRQ